MKVLWKQGVAVVGIIIVSPLSFETNFKQSKTKTKQTNKQRVKKKKDHISIRVSAKEVR